MSFNAQLTAWKIPGPVGSDRLVLMALAERADEDGTCFPSQATIATDLGLSERTVWASLKALEAMQVISRERQTRGHGGWSSDKYTLLFELRLERKSAPQNPENRDRKKREPLAAETAEEPISGLTSRGSNEPLNEPASQIPSDTGGEFFDFDMPAEAKAAEPKLAKPKSIADPKREATDAFSAWWMLYPRKVGKGGALMAYHRAWKRIGPGAADILTAGVYQLANETAGEEKKFIPHATTWLNEERWTDEPGARGSGAGGNTRAGKGMGSGAYSGGGRPGFGTMADVFFAREREEQERNEVSAGRAIILHPALAGPDD